MKSIADMVQELEELLDTGTFNTEGWNEEDFVRNVSECTRRFGSTTLTFPQIENVERLHRKYIR